MADHIPLLVLGVPATLILALAQLRELMRQIARTAEEWHRMREAVPPATSTSSSRAQPIRTTSATSASSQNVNGGTDKATRAASVIGASRIAS